MTPELFQLFLGVFALTLIAAYSCWVRLRVILFREELFSIRDALWDSANKLNALDDSAYKSTRSAINGCIHGAGTISFPIILSQLSQVKSTKIPRTDNKELQGAIHEAFNRIVRSLIVYLIFYRPISGAFYLFAFVSYISMRMAVRRWLSSDGPLALPRIDDRAQAAA